MEERKDKRGGRFSVFMPTSEPLQQVKREKRKVVLPDDFAEKVSQVPTSFQRLSTHSSEHAV